MKIRTKLTINNICVTAAVLVIIFAIISIVSEHTRSRAFFHDLKGEALTKANLFLENQVDAETMQSIYLNNRQFINEVEVAVYTTDFRNLYHDAAQIDIIKEDRAMIDRILAEKEIEFYVGDYQCIGFVYAPPQPSSTGEGQGGVYIVTAAAYDGYGYDNLRQLQKALVGLFFIGLALLFLAGYILARSALKPIREIVSEAEKITSQDIDKRLEIKNEKDELGELCTTFNALLSRLESSFNAQRQFVANVSHELRTPLAALSAEIDLALQKERTPEQYRAALENSLGDARRMTRLIEGLLNLAKADYNKEGIKMQEIRLDELLLDVRASILKAHPEYHIELVFDFLDSFDNFDNFENHENLDNNTKTSYPHSGGLSGADTHYDDRMITVRANLYLLSIAFTNLIENNCKYSPDHTSLVQISHWESQAIARFSDTGRGMTAEEKSHIFDLFYRGDDSCPQPTEPSPSLEGRAGVGLSSLTASLSPATRDGLAVEERSKVGLSSHEGRAGGRLGHGIGMTLAQKIIHLHDGQISVHTQQGEGTTFVVELPHV